MGILRERLQRLNLAFVVYGPIDRPTGGNIYDGIVVRHLRLSGDTVDVLSLPSPESGVSAFRTGVKMLKETLSPENRYDGVVFDALVSRTAAAFFSEAAYRERNAGRRKPVIFTLVHMLVSGGVGFSPGLSVGMRDERLLFEHSDVLIVNSRTTLLELSSQYDLKKPVHVCRPGKDAPDEGRLPSRYAIDHTAVEIESGPVKLLCSGNLLPGKGYHRLPGILGNLKDLPWRLTIAGDPSPIPEYTGGLLGDFEKAGIRERLALVGSLSPGDLGKLYAGSDIFLQTSSHESYGISLAEALHYGLPFVAFDEGAAGEVAGTGFRPVHGARFSDAPETGANPSGFLVPGFSDADFTACLRSLIENHPLRRLMRKNAFEAGKTLPAWKDTCDTFRDILLSSM